MGYRYLATTTSILQSFDLSNKNNLVIGESLEKRILVITVRDDKVDFCFFSFQQKKLIFPD